MKPGDRVKSIYTGRTAEVIAFDSHAYPGEVEVQFDDSGAYDHLLPVHLEVLHSETYGDLVVGTQEVRVTDPTTGGQKGSKPQQPAQIPPRFLLALGQHFGEGQAKYPDSEPGLPNWSRGYAWSLSANALERHLLAWLAGEDFDEDGRHNLVAVAWHASVLYTFQTEDLGTDDRPGYYKGGAA